MRPALEITIPLLIAASLVYAEPYQVNYEGDVFPEEVGWERYTTGGGATRSIQNGVLLLESTDPLVSDVYLLDRQGQLDAGLGEMFYAEWRMRLLPGSGIADVDCFMARDSEAGDINMTWSSDYFWSLHDDHEFPIDATEFHCYRVESTNMVEYDFFIDGAYRFTGFFDPPGVTSSWVYFGDSSIGQASSSEWDYFRFGVMPISGTGDIDHDGDIDLGDFATFALCFMGSEVFAPPPACAGQEFILSDLDYDGDVDLGDFSTFALAFGTGRGASAQPTTAPLSTGNGGRS